MGAFVFQVHFCQSSLQCPPQHTLSSTSKALLQWLWRGKHRQNRSLKPSMASLNLSASILAFPTEVWDLIVPHIEDNGLFKLIYAGNRTLSAKLLQVSDVKAHWMNLRHCNWIECKPFISQFSKLKSLTISSDRPSQIPKSLLSPAMLPSSMVSLTLFFAGALDLLVGRTLFLGLQSLESLRVASGASLETLNVGPRGGWIDLAQFPPGLRHLTMGFTAPYKASTYFLKTPEGLPPNLLTYDCFAPIRRTNNVVLGSSELPSSLTRLAIQVEFNAHIDITHCASTLQVLRVYSGNLKFANKRVERLFSREGLPLRTIFPVLNTLVLPWGDNLPCHIFETLPLCLVNLGSDFDFTNATAEDLALCQKLNRLYLESNDPNRPGAPVMIRTLRLSPVSIAVNQSPELDPWMPVFPSLTSCLFSRMDVSSFDGIPKDILSLEANIISAPLQGLPHSLQTLKCGDLQLQALDEATSSANVNEIPDLSLHEPIKFPPLVELSITHVYLTLRHVSILPRTLEKLQCSLDSHEALEALTQKANVDRLLPLLSSLIFNDHLSHSKSSPSSIIVISLDTIPSTITSLEIGTSVGYAPQADRSLHLHPSLTDLKVTYAEYFEVITHQLPPQLRKLEIKLKRPVDLNLFSNVQLLLDMPKLLEDIDIKLDVRRMHAWFVPFKHCSLISLISEIRRLPNLPIGYHILKSLPSFIIPTSLLWILSESFALSLIPRRTIVFRAQHPSFNLIQHNSPLHHMIEFYLARRAVGVWRSFATFRCPLVSLCVPSHYTRQVPTDSQIFLRFKNLPPSISHFDPIDGELATVRNDHVRERYTRVPCRDSLDSVERRFSWRMALHFISILAWALIWLAGIVDQESILSWLPHTMAVGSTLAIATQFFTYRYLIRSFFTTWKSVVREFWIGGLILLWLISTTNAAGIIALGASAWSWNLPSRLVALLVAFIGETYLAFVISEC